MQSDMQRRSDQECRFAPVERRLACVRRGWRHERGAEAVEVLALIVIIMALLAVISLMFRDRAAAIGEAATATLARWLAGMPGTASVGDNSVIVSSQVTALPHTVVSLPQMLGQAADAAPWVERAIGIAGSLLAGIVAWLTVAHQAPQHTSNSWFSQASDALRWTGEQAAGVFVGLFEGVYDTVAGLAALGIDLVKMIVGDADTRQKYGALIEALITDPLGTARNVLWSIVEPIVDDWQEGRHGEAVGRTVFEILPAILSIFTGGATAAGYASKAGTAGRAVDILGDAGRVMSHIDDAARIANRIDDVGRVANRIDDVGRAANRIDDVGRVANRIDDVGRVAGKLDDAGHGAGTIAHASTHINKSVRAVSRSDDVVDAAQSVVVSTGPVTAGEAGRFGDLAARGVTGDNLTPHHMPQAAMRYTGRNDGGALVITHGEHIQTRTYGVKGALTAKSEAGQPFRSVLARDIRDIRRIVGGKYNHGLRELLRYYREHFPQLMKKE